MNRKILLTLLTLNAGCYSSTPVAETVNTYEPTIIVDGHEVYENSWNNSIIELQKEMFEYRSCGKDNLSFELILVEQKNPLRVRIKGCNAVCKFIKRTVLTTFWLNEGCSKIDRTGSRFRSLFGGGP
jgi:hypothetical protein